MKIVISLKGSGLPFFGMLLGTFAAILLGSALTRREVIWAF